jgi:hypothetical protein
MSCLTLSSHLLLGLPCNISVMGFYLYIFLTILLSDILCTCPNQLNLWALIWLIMLLCFIKWSNSSLVLILHVPSSSFLCPNILLEKQHALVTKIDVHLKRNSDENRRILEFFHLPSFYSAWGGLITTFRGYLLLPSSWVKLSKKKQPASPFKMGLIGSTETSVLNHLTPRNNPEGGSLR